MSADILQFRMPEVKGTQPPNRPAGNRLFCVKCDNDLFHLCADGRAHCCRCGLPMTNIRVTVTH